jgi:hypothetical protein
MRTAGLPRGSGFRKPLSRKRCGLPSCRAARVSGSRYRVSDADCQPAARLGAARTPSPDVRLGPRGLGSLECRRRFAIVAPLGVIRRLPGHGQPLAEFDLQALSCLPWPVARTARSVNRVCTGSSIRVTFSGPVPSIRSALERDQRRRQQVRLPVVRQDPGPGHARQYDLIAQWGSLLGGRLRTQRGAAGAPGAGLWEQAQPGWRSAADMQ